MLESPVRHLGERAGVALRWLERGQRVALALLVEVENSAPLDPGTFMLIDESGAIEGSVTGGCVESDVATTALEILAQGGPPRLMTYGISDELAGTVGLMCGGTVHIFIQELGGEDEATVVAALRSVEQGQPAALATLLDGADAGARLAIIGERVVGGLRGPELLDRNVARDAAGLLERGVTTIRKYGADGAVLDSDIRVHVTSFAEPPQMVIFGAIDFSAALAPLAHELGYEVAIVDARPPFASSPRFARAAEVIVAWPQDALAARTLGARDAVLVFTHDPKFDEPAILAALATDVGYIGVLGSRKTTADRNRRLREAGATDEMIGRLAAPCGLDIGARTPSETAISILAEIIASRSGRAAAPLRSTEGPIRVQSDARAAGR
jgi:xanthine dehydrogenase accessory factor